MRGGPLRVVASAGAAVATGRFTASTVSSVSLGRLYTVVERPQVWLLFLVCSEANSLEFSLVCGLYGMFHGQLVVLEMWLETD